MENLIFYAVIVAYLQASQEILLYLTQVIVLL